MSVTTLAGLSVVISGGIVGHTRTSANAYIASQGAHVQDRVTRDTDLLIIGNKPGATKLIAASRNGVQVISWADAMDLIAGKPAVASTVAPEPPSSVNKPAKPPAGHRQIFPMLCKAAAELPKTGDWLYEIKWDGYRCVAYVNGGTVLASRSGKDYFTGKGFDHIYAELDGLTVPCILDGEICVLDEQGRADRERLQKGDVAAAKFIVFDVLEAMGTDITGQPLRERKRLLSQIVEGGMYVTESPVFEEDERDALMAYASENDIEGIVAKPADAVYKEKARGPWLKIKLRVEQEFVIVGYKAGKGRRAGTAGAFLLAVNVATKSKPQWEYVGDVGTGGTDDFFEEIRQACGPQAQPAIPITLFAKAERKEITFVEPRIVVDVKFQDWTSGGRLFHPSIQRMRDDKNAREVIRET
jgi:bifunctional non-homologous end joining protein LigD